MKISKVTAAKQNPTQVIFYKITADALREAYSDDKSNLFIQHMIEKEGMSCIDLKQLYGSDIIDDVLYLCVDRGYDIVINGEEVNPEEALDKYTVEELSAYIQEADEETIQWYINEAVITFDDPDDIAIELLEAGHSFREVADNFFEIWPED